MAMNSNSETLESSFCQLLNCLHDPINHRAISLESAWQQLLATRKLEKALESHIFDLNKNYINLSEIHWTVRVVLQACIRHATALAEDARVLRRYLMRMLNQSNNETQQLSTRQQQKLKENLCTLLNVERTILIRLCDLLASK